MIFSGLLALAISRQELPSYSMAGYKVPAVFVAEPDATAQLVEGVRYQVTPDGKLVDSFVGNGRIDEILRLYAAATVKWDAKTPRWPVKVIIRVRGDQLILGQTIRQKRTFLSDQDTARIYGSVAQFCAMAEAYAEGRIRVDLHVEVDAETAFDANIQPYLETHLNGARFDADDGLYRGPYGSVFVIDSLPAEAPWDVTVAGRNAHVLPYYLAYETSRPLALASRMLAGFCSDLFFASGVTHDVRISRPSDGVSQSIWARAIEHLGKPTAVLPELRSHALEAGLPLPGDPFAVLPTVSLASLDPQGELKVGSEGLPDQIDSSFDSEREACAAIGVAGNQLVFVRWRFAALLGARIPNAKAVAVAWLSGDPVVVFRVEVATDKSEAEWLGLDIPKRPEKQSVRTIGNFAVQRITDPVYGAGVKISPDSPVPWGRVILLTRERETGGFVEFMVRASKPLPMALFWDSRTYDLFGRLGEVDSKGEELVVVADGKWHRVCVAVGMAREFGISSGRGQAGWVATWFDPPVLETAGWRIVDKPSDGISEIVPSMPTPARGELEPARLRAQLKDSDELVRLNAVYAFTKVKDAQAEGELIRMIPSINPRIGQAACQALAFQGGTAGKTALLNTVTNGVNELVRVAAADALAQSGDKALTGPLSTMLTCKSRFGRIAGVRALSQLPGKEPNIVMLAFLQDVDPMVRREVMERASPGEQLVRQRMQYYIVNDPSEAVRSMAAIKLRTVESAESGSASDAQDDVSGWVRLAFAKQVQGLTWEQVHVGMADPWPSVRAASLVSAAQMPGFSLEHVKILLNDADILVSRELARVAERHKIQLPAEVIERLKGSVDHVTSDIAKRLSQ